MSKVTTKLQVTMPKAIAEAFGVRPGDEIEWVAAHDAIRVVPAHLSRKPVPADRLKLFDQATERQRRRQRNRSTARSGGSRGWKREDLYRRGSSG